MMKRRTYDRAYKLQVVNKLNEGNTTASQVARDFELPAGIVARWLRESLKDPVNAFPGQGRSNPEREEHLRLREENARLKAERDVLKKAMAYFAMGKTEPSVSLQSIEGNGQYGGCAGFSMSRPAVTTVGSNKPSVPGAARMNS